MYILVEHTISEPGAFWRAAEGATYPPPLKLHQTFPTRDGSHAACLWEADSANALKTFLEPLINRYSHNEYFEVENREGLAMPSNIQPAADART
jgi:hypothetical protein